MARKKVERVIAFSDGEERRFEIQAFKVRDGHAVLERLVTIAGPVLGALADGLGASPDQAVAGDLSAQGLSDAFDALAQNVTKNEGVYDWTSEKVRKVTKIETDVEGQFVSMTGDIYEETFCAEYGAEIELMTEAFKLNFGSLFSKAGGLGVAARRFVTPKRSS